MSLLEPPASNPDKSRAMAFTIAALSLVVIVALWYAFRYYPEKRAAQHFFDALVAGVVAVIELDRLFDRVLHDPRVGRARVQHETTGNTHRSGRDEKKRQLRQGIVSGAKERTHPRSRSI